jgi:hypothetical protein
VDSSGEILCACPDGYTGASCETCAPGLSHDANGVCVFVDPIVNGSFSEMETGWTVVGLTVTDAARFAGTTPCNARTLGQTVSMPPRSQAGPLVLAFTRANVAAGSASQLYVKIGTVVHSTSTSGSKRICLGEGAYDGPLEISFRANPTPTCAETYQDITVDDVAILPAVAGDNCPSETGLRNGSFDSAGDHWSATGSYVFSGGQVAITSSGFAPPAGITQKVSFPRATTTPLALTVRYSMSFTNDPVVVGVSLGSYTLAQLPAGTDLEHRICLPPWALGGVDSLRIGTVATGTQHTASHTESLTITEVLLEPHPDCAASALFNGGFELTSFMSWWNGTVGLATTATIPADAAQARSGERSGRLSVGRLCYGTRWVTAIAPRPRSSALGQAVEVYARYPTSTNSSVLLCVGTGVATGICLSPATNAGYVRRELCIPRQAEGLPLYLTGAISGNAGGCSTTFTAETLHLDDVALIDSVNCP